MTVYNNSSTRNEPIFEMIGVPLLDMIYIEVWKGSVTKNPYSTQILSRFIARKPRQTQSDSLPRGEDDIKPFWCSCFAGL